LRNKNIDFSDLQNGGQSRVTIEMKGIVSVSTKRVLLATIPEIILAGIHTLAASIVYLKMSKLRFHIDKRECFYCNKMF